jgi:DNA invertase Pin-like site-specific DNA recombinase
MLQIGAVFAEMERNLIRERTRAGLSAGAEARSVKHAFLQASPRHRPE